MVGKTKRSVYRKSRKSRGFTGVRKQEHEEPVPSSTVTQVVDHVENSNIAQLPNNTETCSDSVELSTPISASRKKLSQHVAQEFVEREEMSIRPSQYRLVDIRQLSSALSDIHRCEQGRYCDLFLL